MAASINASTTAGVVTTADTSGVLNIQTANTTAISISASQVVSYTNNPTYSGGTANGVLYLNGSKVATSGSALTFDGTNLSNTRSVATAFSGSNSATWANGIVLTNTATPATGVASLIQFGGTSNVNSVFGVAQNSSGFGDFVWASYSGSFSEQMRLTSTGLGIGTSSPAVKLQVDGGATSGTIGQFGNAQGGVILGAASSTAYVNTTSSSPLAFQINGTERMRLDSSGNLGLGVTPSNAYTLTKSFEYQSGGIFPRSGETNFTFNATQNSGASWIYGATNSASLFQIKPASFVWQIAGSGTAGNAITFTQAMTLDASGNLLLGSTVSPSGSSNLSIKAGQSVQWQAASASTLYADIYADTSNNLVFRTGSGPSERARIDSSGNFQFNSGYGSVAIAYGCRVWVSYNTVTSTSIRGNGGVSSLTDNGTGDTTINFSVTMPDTNYSVVGATKLADSTTTTNNTMIVGPFSFGTTSVRIYTTRPGDSLNDCAIVNISIFR